MSKKIQGSTYFGWVLLLATENIDLFSFGSYSSKFTQIFPCGGDMFLVVQSIFNDWSGLVLPIQVNSEDECLRIKPSPSRGSVVFPAASDGSQRSACPGRRAPPRPPSPWSARG